MSAAKKPAAPPSGAAVLADTLVKAGYPLDDVLGKLREQHPASVATLAGAGAHAPDVSAERAEKHALKDAANLVKATFTAVVRETFLTLLAEKLAEWARSGHTVSTLLAPSVPEGGAGTTNPTLPTGQGGQG